jgi:hypothetical protein
LSFKNPNKLQSPEICETQAEPCSHSPRSRDASPQGGSAPLLVAILDIPLSPGNRGNGVDGQEKAALQANTSREGPWGGPREISTHLP